MAKLSKDIGTRFEERFFEAAKAAGHYIQQMPARVGYDFLLGTDDQLEVVETKCVKSNHLRLKHFTPIELRIAEEMTERGANYNIVFPLYNTFGKITWKEIREMLFSGKGVILDDPFSKRALSA